MLRNVAVLMSALVAMSSQAQDASTPQVVEEKPALAAPSADGEPSPTALAPRGPVESGRPLPSPSAPPAKPDAKVEASTREKSDDCAMTQSFIDDEDVPMAVRYYEPAPLNLAGQQQKATDIPPKVRRAGRCLRKYIIQVKSVSDKPWVVKNAKLVGSDGEVLEVTEIYPRRTQNVSFNIITAVKAEGVAEPNYVLRIILLTGEDGRAVVLENVELP